MNKTIVSLAMFEDVIPVPFPCEEGYMLVDPDTGLAVRVIWEEKDESNKQLHNRAVHNPDRMDPV